MPVGVAIVTAVFPPSVGGIQSHTLALGKALAARGAAVHVITRRHASLPRTEMAGGLTIHRVGAGDASPALATLSFLAAAVGLLRSLRSRIDVVHAHQLLSPTTIALFARPLFDLPVILNPHACGDFGDVGTLRRQGLLGRVRLARASRTADAFVCISEEIRRELLQIGVDAKKLWRITNGVDVRRFRPADEPEKQRLRAELDLPAGRVIVYAGRLSHEKGVDVLLQAWPRVAGDAHLIVLGSGPMAPAPLPRIHWKGPIADVSPYLRAADAFVLPSRTEGLPVALLEAMACGLPSVATRTPGSLEVLRDGWSGRTVPPEDPEALARGIQEVLEGAEAPVWGARARDHVERHHSLDVITDRYLQLYRAVASGMRTEMSS